MGRIDVPVNAGGTNAPGTIEELDVEGWDRTFYVNTRVPFCCPRALALHTGDGSGTLINVSSVAGKRGWANATACCASKFGFTGFTEALADDMYGCD
jgi:3-oxoacyl-[acyl-carrier protein] reductase